MISFKNIDNEPFGLFRHNVKSSIPFEVTGLVSVLRLYLAIKAGEYSKKNVLFITSSEQSALKYKNDFSRLFDEDAVGTLFQVL